MQTLLPQFHPLQQNYIMLLLQIHIRIQTVATFYVWLFSHLTEGQRYVAAEHVKRCQHKFSPYHLHWRPIKLIYYKYSSPVFTAHILVSATSFKVSICRCWMSQLCRHEQWSFKNNKPFAVERACVYVYSIDHIFRVGSVSSLIVKHIISNYQLFELRFIWIVENFMDAHSKRPSWSQENS